MKRIPQHGLGKEELFRRLEQFRKDDVNWRDGRVWAYVYDPGAEAEEVIKRAYTTFLTENALDPTAFPSGMRLENELVSMAASHLRGDENTVGNFTSGGTESIILAVKTARDFARARRPKATKPHVLLPTTAHAAFHKACHYLDVDVRLAPVDPVTFKADPAAMRAAVDENTILMVGSAISYAHGVVDPIRELGQIALEKDVLLHVDGCMGGFLLPYFRRLGAPVPDFELHVPGVTSISMDFHKYAFAAKGASVILYKSADLRQYQLYACSNWTGYTVINATVQSTKSVGPLAAAWAVLNHFGDEGYLALAKQVLDCTRRIADEVEKIPGLKLLGRPEMNLVAFTSDGPSVFHVIDEMKLRGWYIQPQLGYGPSRENIHLSIMPSNVKWTEPFLRDLRESVEKAKALPSGELKAKIEQAFAGVDPASISDETIQGLLTMAGAGGEELPERMAEVNETLNALPWRLRERLLVAYLNTLYRQPKEGA